MPKIKKRKKKDLIFNKKQVILAINLLISPVFFIFCIERLTFCVFLCYYDSATQLNISNRVGITYFCLSNKYFHLFC